MLGLQALVAAVAIAATQTGDIIGVASMRADGTIEMEIRSVQCDGSIAHGHFTYRPDDPRYQSINKHLGILKPGDVNKPVPAWPTEPCPK